jgi:8-oxo-dGTP diphosphatase
MNEGKWIGIGGKVEDGETPDECNKREVFEETGLILRSAHFYGVIRFRSDEYEDEDMYLYSSDDFEPSDPAAIEIFTTTGRYDPPECSEGELRWVDADDILDLPTWAGDRAFLTQMLSGYDHISMTLSYTGEMCTVSDDLHSAE